MLRIEDKDGVRTLILDRPERLNTFTQQMVFDLHEALIDCRRDPGVKVVVLTGAGETFCSGFDLASDGEIADDLSERWKDDPIWQEPEQMSARLLEESQIPVLLHRMPKPTIASVRGAVAGTGMILAAACDLRIASDTAFFKTAFASSGRCGDAGGSYLLSHLVSPARELYLLDRKIQAERALDIGLINCLFPNDQLDAETEVLALEFARGPGLAYAGIKRNLFAAETGTLEETIASEQPTNVRAVLSRDGREAARAFMEKRKPWFLGY